MADGTVKDIEDEIPFDVPEGWAWVRLQEIADIARGGSPRPIDAYLTAEETGINWIKIGDTKPGSKYIVSAKEKIKFEGKKHSRFVHAGDFLLTNSMSFGRPYILKIDGCIHDGWLVFANIKNCLLQDYLYYALSSKYIYDSFSLVAAGSTVKNLKSDTVKQVLFPLPPINEQKKILEEIERIITLIEEVENDKADLQVAIKQAKSKILDLAIHGKLVAQDPNAEPASVLLEKLRAEKEAKIKSGELKRDKNDSYIYKSATDNCHFEKFADGTETDIEAEIPFDIPESWAWTKIRCVSSEILYGVSESAKETGKYKLLRITDIQDDKVNWDSVPFTDYPEEKVTNYFLKNGDIVFARTGATVGKSYLVENLTVESIYASYLIRIRTSQVLNQKYIKYYFGSQTYWNQITDKSSGIGQPNVNGTSLANLIVPLPPLAEQKRIVEKIENAFAKLDFIAEQLA